MGAPLGSLAWLLLPTRAAQRHRLVPSLPAAAPGHDAAAVRGQLPAPGRAGAALPAPGLHVPPAPRHRRLLLPQGERWHPTPEPQALLIPRDSIFLGRAHNLCPAQREKSRVLYLYNKLLRQRQCFVRLQRKRIARRARRYPALVSGDGDAGLAPHQGAGPPLPTPGWAAQGVPRSPGPSYLPHGVASPPHGAAGAPRVPVPAAGDVPAGVVLPALAATTPLGALAVHGVRGAQVPPGPPGLPLACLRRLVLQALLEGRGPCVPRLHPRGPRPLRGQQRGAGGVRGLRAPGTLQ